MAINLSKGGRVNLAKEAPGLKKVIVGLGWSPNLTDTGKGFDLDASIFACKTDAAGNPKLVNDDYFIFYNHPTKVSPDGAISHSGDNLTGIGDGDDEVITVDFSKINPDITSIVFIVTIHEAAERKQNFGQVAKSFIRLLNDETKAEIAKYDLEDNFSNETAVEFGSFVKKDDGSWVFKAVGTGFNKGLDHFVGLYSA